MMRKTLRVISAPDVGHQAFEREYAQAGQTLARRAARHQRLEDEVVEKVDSRRPASRRRGTTASRRRDRCRNRSCRGSATRRAAGRPSRAPVRISQSMQEGEGARAGAGEHEVRVDAGGARHARAWAADSSPRATCRVHAAPRCSSSASCSAWCSCCSESSSSSILPCMMSASLYSVRLMR